MGEKEPKPMQPMDEPSDYQKYLDARHASFEISRDELDSVVKEATAVRPAMVQRLTSGEVNEVYDVTLPSEEHVIVRISRHEDSEFGREVWAIDRARTAGVPVPEMLLVTEIHTESTGTVAACVQKKLEGEPLERGTIDFQKLDPELQRSYMRQAGEILAKIHSVEVTGFDYLDTHGQGYMPSFRAMMSRAVRARATFEAIAAKRGMDRKVLDDVLNLLEENVAQAQEFQPVLTHNDFGPKHIMVNEGKIMGILDWGAAAGHSPVNDFAGFQLWYPELPLDAVKEGYSDKRLFENGFEKKMQWIALDNALGALEWYDKNNYEQGVKDIFQKMQRILRASS